MINMKTAGSYIYDIWWFTIPPQLQITFKLTACYDASILLSQMQLATGSKAHEIRLGTYWNTKSSFHADITDSGYYTEVDTPGILNCDEPRAFWLSFGDGLINIGTGPQIGINSFLSYNSTLDIRYLSFTTNNNATGNWMILQSGDSGEF
jgi:Farnesoic acid 0-methyl transferase